MFPVSERSALQIRPQASSIATAREAMSLSAMASTRIVLAAAGLSGALVGMLFGMVVVQRRRDCGRRRVIGATPQFIAGLVVAQAALVSLMAYLTALATESIYAWWTSGPFPPLSLAAGMGLILLSAGCLGAMVPALAAARHDPLLEVRVP